MFVWYSTVHEFFVHVQYSTGTVHCILQERGERRGNGKKKKEDSSINNSIHNTLFTTVQYILVGSISTSIYQSIDNCCTMFRL